jgi:Sulfotransferase family
VHIIRDGRDIALSLKKMGGFALLPWDLGQTESLVATSLYWEWMLRKGREHGRKFPADYIEIRYEDLIGNPTEVLGKFGGFLDHDLDYDRFYRPLRERTSSFPTSALIQPAGSN